MNNPHRLSINVPAPTLKAIDKVVELTDDSKTQVVNDAVQFYAKIRVLVASGGAVFIRDPGSTELERVRFF